MTGAYFDGLTSRRRPVDLLLDRGQVLLYDQDQALARRAPAMHLSLAEPSLNGPIILRFPDGACCHFPAMPALYEALQEAGVPLAAEARFFTAITRSPRLIALVLGFLVAVVAAGYVWFIPTTAELVAPMVPEDVKQLMGVEVLAAMDRSHFKPTAIPEERRRKLEKALDALLVESDGEVALHLRRFPEGGPNAFALPGGILVVTDELVELLDGDLEALKGIMAHELGHMSHDHIMRQLIQAGLLHALSGVLIGDFSGFLAMAPAVLGTLKYSRMFEAEADQISYKRLCALGISPAATARFFLLMRKKFGAQEDAIPAYLSSHGASERRAAYFREPCPPPGL